MSDLFGSVCPNCGQPTPESDEKSFTAFWSDAPVKVGKAQARKAWHKLSTPERYAAHKQVKAFYDWFKRQYPTASPLHPSTYLGQRRWEDEGVTNVKHLPQSHRLANAANAIKSGKRFLCTHISATMARECIEADLVTPDQCREVGVI